MAAARLEKWYQEIYSRRVDLVGDYAGSELFLIEGDSLLLDAFSDPHLDFQDGFQLLHAAYNVELFLKKFIVRRCRFHVVFFDEQEQLCVPPSATDRNISKYLLARAAIIRHLKRNVSQDIVPIHTFSSVASAAFLDYLHSSGMYFVMCHDGAQGDTDRTVGLRWQICWLMQQGYNVALTNSVEIHDTKVRT
jgi:ATP-dependent RNA helicase DDX60